MTKQRAILVFLLVSYLSATYLSYSTYIQGDFSIYYQAGERIRKGLDLYLLNDNLYVYGPLLANLISPFTIFDQLLVSRVWLVLSILSTLTASWLFYRAYAAKFVVNGFLAFTGILVLGFAFRNNLGNGNVMAFVLLCVALAMRLAQRSGSILGSVSLSLITIFVFEVKTYIAIFLIAFLFIQKRFLALGLSIFFAFTVNLMYFIASGVTYLDWVDSLKVRSSGVSAGSDQATILVFANRIIPGPLILGIAVALALYSVIFLFLYRNLKLENSSEMNIGLLLFSAAPILTVFSHGQDFILSTLILGFLAMKVDMGENTKFVFKVNVYAALGLLVNWTNQSLSQAFFIFLFLLFILIFPLQSRKLFISISLLLFTLSVFINAFLLSQGGDIQYVAYNFQALLFGLCTFAAVVQKIKNESSYSKAA